jgi:uncharacterized protein (DUF2062 family)
LWAAHFRLAARSDPPRWLIRVVVIALLAQVLNSISRNAGERRIWVPVAIAMLVCSLVVALTAP